MNVAAPPNAPPFLLRLLHQRKHRASQLYLLMTLGPTPIGLALTEKARILSVFGRVPISYYLLHIPAIHLAGLAVGYLREGAIHPERFAHAPFTQVPAAQVWSLQPLYPVFAIVVAGLYFPFSSIRRRGRGKVARPRAVPDGGVALAPVRLEIDCVARPALAGNYRGRPGSANLISDWIRRAH